MTSSDQQKLFDDFLKEILNPPKKTFFQKHVLPFAPVLFVAFRLLFAALVLWAGSVLASDDFSWVPQLSFLNSFGWVLVLDVLSGFARRAFVAREKI